MTYFYYTNIQNRREAIKEAVAVLLEHEPFYDNKGEKQYLSTCADEDPKELVDALFDAICDLSEIDLLLLQWTTEGLEQRFKDEIVKRYGDVEAYKTHLIEISENDERIQNILAQYYYENDYQELALRGCKWAFEEELASNDFPDVVELFLKCKDKKIIDAYREVLEEDIEAAVANGDDTIIDILTSLKAYKYLEEQELCTYKWVENCLDGEDKVAEIASKHLAKVICNKKALKWLKEKAASKVPQAQYLIALLYLPNDLDIVSENKSLAMRYLQAAKESGCSLADAELQKLGVNAATTFEDENTLLAKAKVGDKSAMFELGNLYAFEGNDAEAKKWWKKAQSKGRTGTNSKTGNSGRKPKTFFQKVMITIKKMF